MVTILALAFVLSIVIGASVKLSASQNARQRTVLGPIARALGGQHDSSSVKCVSNGMQVSFRFTSRGISSGAETWTEVDVDLPRSYPLALRVVRHSRNDRVRVERGVDGIVRVGDPDFDAMFLVEAAPADVVRALLDEPARTFLASYAAAELSTERDHVLRFALPGWIEAVQPAAFAVHGVARIGSRLRDAYAAADEAVPTREGGSPYRQLVDDSPARDAAAVRARELAALDALNARRVMRDRIAVGVMIAALSIGLIVVAMAIVP